MIELTFLKELMLMRQANQKGVMFITIGIFLNKGFKFQPYVYNSCHDLLMISMTFSNIAILNIEVLIIAALLAELAKVRQ